MNPANRLRPRASAAGRGCRPFVAILAAIIAVTFARPADAAFFGKPDAPETETPAPENPRPDKPEEHPPEGLMDFNDRARIEELERVGKRMIEDGATTPCEALRRQLARRHCGVRPIDPSAERLAPAQLYERFRPSILIVSGIYKCKKCGRFHAGVATGFPLNETGAIVTCHHVVADRDNRILLAMTDDNRVFPVTEVLAASRDDDVAILRLELGGARLRPLALAADPPIGAPVYLISHPEKRFYTFTNGLVSQYTTRPNLSDRPSVVMSVTAEFARGSSGGPILDDHGAVAGIAASTANALVGPDAGHAEQVQMTFRQCAPASAIRRLLSEAPVVSGPPQVVKAAQVSAHRMDIARVVAFIESLYGFTARLH
jgi:S1-C subfamily serine protease